MTDDYDIGDVIRAALGNPLDAVAKAVSASEAAIEKQVKAPTDNELADIEKLATEAAELQDELRAAVGDKQGRLKALVGQLKAQMLQHGLKDISITGRPPIELVEKNNRKPTRKGIVDVFQEQLKKQYGKDREQEAMTAGTKKGFQLWNSIKPTTSHSVSIPNPTPPEMEAPY